MSNTTEEWNACEQRVKTMVIELGKIIREAKGLPPERNITVIYNETMALLNMVPSNFITTPGAASHLPTPEESARENPNNPYVLDCPVCGEKSYYFTALCSSCEASEGGKYKVKFECFKCHHTEKSEEPVVVWLNKLGIDFGTQTKESLGIKTTTDEGVK